MFKELFASGDFNAFAISGLLIFFGMMILITIWVMLPGRRGYYDRIAAESVDCNVTGDSQADLKSSRRV